ncbi:MAG: diguanylate cyclase [Desulfuromonadaceae bacterium]|nr:diguanylate cyclase [Desulfuromonadaceae bacterium]MDD5105994.1 diguanylate cyclase [Desulfuromonadaceae bacterium]
MKLEKRVGEALLRQLIANSAIPLIGSAVASLLVAISLIGSIESYIIVGWLLLVYATLGIRIWLTRRCQARLASTGYDAGDAIRYAMTAGLSGIAWGIGGVLIKGATPLAMIVIITAIQAMVMGGVLTLGTLVPAFIAFALPAVLPMVFVLAFSGGVANTVLAIYSFLFLALMVGIAIRFNRSLRYTWQLTFEKEDLVTSLTEAHDNLALLATTDGLTGIANRRHFDAVIEVEFARLYRSKAPLSLILLDIDHFKLFNDAYGHVAGDQCLKNVAGVFQRCITRAPDLAARYGGEEFAAILPETDYRGAITLAEKIRAKVAGMAIPHCDSGTESYVTVSLGVVTLDCTKVQSPLDAVAITDRQLYRAKSEGRNRIASWNGMDVHPVCESMLRLTWNTSYDSGEPTIDNEHRELFLLANVLLEKVLAGNTEPDQFKQAFDNLQVHIVKHFAHEESILLEHGYDRVVDHTERHCVLVESAMKLRRQFEESGVSVGELVEFLVSEVVVGHMLNKDRAFFGLFADNKSAGVTS